MNAFKDIVRPYVDQDDDGVIEVSAPDAAGRPQFCLVTLALREGNIIGAAAFIVRRANQDEARPALSELQRATNGS